MLKSNILKRTLNLPSSSTLKKGIKLHIPQKIECSHNVVLTYVLPCSRNGFDTFSDIILKLDGVNLNHFFKGCKMTANQINELFFSYLKIDKNKKTTIISTRLGEPTLSLFDMIDYIKINNFVFDKSNIFVLKQLNKNKNLSNHEIFLPNLFSKDNLKSKIIQISINTSLQCIRFGSNVCSSLHQFLFGDGNECIETKFSDFTIEKQCDLNLNFNYTTIIKNFKKFKPQLNDIQLFRPITPYMKEIYLMPCVLHAIISKKDIQFLLLLDEIPIDTYTTNKKLNINLKFSKKIQLVFDTAQKKSTFYCYIKYF